ncbi:MAG: CBS domain-containing protein [Actinomycetota bacterium]|nr:CBS domain-containing protein [Actinomycetota bacterium]
MSPSRITESVVRETPLLRADQRVDEAVRAIVDAGLPALPVVDSDDGYYGIFGEREFIAALFPGYLGELRSAAFVPGSIDDVIDKRIECSRQPVARFANTEAIAAGPQHSDAQLAETFLHHRVLIVPIVENRLVTGAVTRSDFFRALVERFTGRA